jgi:hypothetical protein
MCWCRCRCGRRSWRSRRRRLSWCWCRRRWLVDEGAGEFLHTPITAVKGASGNVHGVEARHYRRRVKQEPNREVAVYQGGGICRSPVDHEIASLDTSWVCSFAQVDVELRWRNAHNNAATAGAGHRTTRRCRCRRRWLVSERAGEFLHTSIAAVKSARGNMHRVLARYHR